MDQFGHLSLCRVAKLDAAAHHHLTGGHSSHGSADAVAAAVAGDSAKVLLACRMYQSARLQLVIQFRQFLVFLIDIQTFV